MDPVERLGPTNADLAPLGFDQDMKGISDLTCSMFDLSASNRTPDLNELEKLQTTNDWLQLQNQRAKETVDTARNQIRELSRIATQQKLAATRPASVPSAAEAQSKLAAMQASRVADMKFNVDEERNLYRWRTELEQMRAELKTEQGEEVWEEEELNSEVLRLKMYRDFGFTPVEDDAGNYSKMIVRSSKSLDARTIELDPKQGNFHYANLLWSALDE